MLFVEILALVAISAALTRFLRQAPQTAGLRASVEGVPLLGSLWACPHCLSFWISLAGTGAMWAYAPRDALELGLMVLLGWRGAWFVNKSLDGRREEERDKASRTCARCGKPWEEDVSLERGHLTFCSTTCWFDFLRARPTPRQNLVGRSGELIRQEIYPVSYKHVTAKEAHDLLQSDDGYIYVDVRSVPEFSNGHPAGSLNVPVFHKEPVGMVPNPDFLTIMEAHFEHEQKLLVGCQSGQRSLRAAEALVAAGFQDVTNVKGGYGGVKDPTGQSVEPGWFEQGLPTDYGEPEERSYAALAGRRREGGTA